VKLGNNANDTALLSEAYGGQAMKKIIKRDNMIVAIYCSLSGPS
jgi:hypothetical protein